MSQEPMYPSAAPASTDSGRPTEEEGRHRRADRTARTAPAIDDRFPGDESPEVVALRADVEQTREDLARTVDQLHAKLDVRGRAAASAREKTERVKEAVLDPDGRPRPPVVGSILLGVLIVAGGVGLSLWRRGRAQGRRPGGWN